MIFVDSVDSVTLSFSGPSDGVDKDGSILPEGSQAEKPKLPESQPGSTSSSPAGSCMPCGLPEGDRRDVPDSTGASIPELLAHASDNPGKGLGTPNDPKATIPICAASSAEASAGLSQGIRGSTNLPEEDLAVAGVPIVEKERSSVVPEGEISIKDPNHTHSSKSLSVERGGPFREGLPETSVVSQPERSSSKEASIPIQEAPLTTTSVGSDSIGDPGKDTVPPEGEALPVPTDFKDTTQVSAVLPEGEFPIHRVDRRDRVFVTSVGRET